MAFWKRALAGPVAIFLAVSLATVVVAAVYIRLFLTKNYTYLDYYNENDLWVSEEPVVRLWKCCRLGEHFDKTLNCVRRPGFTVSNEKYGDKIHPNDSSRYYWIPPQFFKRSVDVAYGYLSHVDKGSSGPSRVIYENYDIVRDSSGALSSSRYPFYVYQHKDNYCAEALEQGGTVLQFVPCDTYSVCVRKCCHNTQLLRSGPRGVECVKEGSEENPFKNYVFFSDTTYQRCQQESFELVDRSLYPKQSIVDAARPSSHLGLPEKGFFSVEICVDTLQQNGSDSKLALGGCLRHIGVWRTLWYLTQPSCIVAALLLVLALVSMVLQPKLRSTNHGRSLTCHAASLLFLNLLHVYFRYIARLPKPWQLEGTLPRFILLSTYQSRITAYLILFCIHSANCWLTILCFNMAHGLRSMRRAPALSSAGRTGSGGEWGLFAFYCSFGFGAPLLLTFLIVYTLETSLSGDYDLFYKWTVTFILPNLIETKTSFFFHTGHPSLFGGLFNESFFYYFLPSGLVLAINVGLFSYIFMMIRMSKRETNAVRKAGEGRANAAHDSAWMYIRLLLSTGVLEAVVELGIWTSLLHTPYSEQFFSDKLRYIVSHYEAPLNIVDVVRAVIIFSLTGLHRNMKQMVCKKMEDIPASGRSLLRMGRRPVSAFVRMVRRVLRRPEETVEMKVVGSVPEKDIATSTVTDSATTTTSTARAASLTSTTTTTSLPSIPEATVISTAGAAIPAPTTDTPPSTFSRTGL